MRRASKSEPQPRQARSRKAKPGHQDERIAAIFQDMRKVSGLTPGQLAKKLGTRLGTIAALEKGAIGALPDWPESSRVIKEYANLVQIDAGPLLRHVALELAPSPAETAAVKRKSAPDKSGTDGGAKSKSQKPRRRSRTGSWLSVLLVFMVGVGAAGYYAVQNPQLAKSALASLPEPVARAIRSARALFDQTNVGGAAVDPRDSGPDKLPSEPVTVPPPR